MTAPADSPNRSAALPRRRSEVEIRWRQFRNAPRPVVRAVLSSLVVAVLGGAAYLVYDVAIVRGASLPGGDLRLLFVATYVAVVLAAGSVVTYLIVPQPRGSGARSARSGWSAALGLFAAVPICYLVMVVIVQVVEPIVLGR
ncbi:MAG TPA: hypothetical protein VKA85_05270 [Candidatus Limnocylindrales bacterium]|nr:hypothetical protein [Candidatus Limnocylindrales bacterium]